MDTIIIFIRHFTQIDITVAYIRHQKNGSILASRIVMHFIILVSASENSRNNL